MIPDVTTLPKLTELESRSISPENQTGAKEMGARASDGWNGSPFVRLFEKDSLVTMADVECLGMIWHIWLAIGTEKEAKADVEVCRNLILRCYWDGQDNPSVECPVGDFFAIAHGRRRAFTSALITNTDGCAINSCLPMPFGSHALITIENDTGYQGDLAYFIDYTLGDAVDECGRLHALFRRENPTVSAKDYVILPKVTGRGVYVGCVLGSAHCRTMIKSILGGARGEVKFCVDGDDQYPTLVGSGLEDYFCASSGLFEHSTLYSGARYCHGHFASCFRWHVVDPVYFRHDLCIEV